MFGVAVAIGRDDCPPCGMIANSRFGVEFRRRNEHATRQTLCDSLGCRNATTKRSSKQYTARPPLGAPTSSDRHNPPFLLSEFFSPLLFSRLNSFVITGCEVDRRVTASTDAVLPLGGGDGSHDAQFTAFYSAFDREKHLSTMRRGGTT